MRRTARTPVGTAGSAPAMLVFAAAALLALPAGAAAQRIAYSGSLHYSAGSYIFTDPTQTWVLLSGLSATTGPVRLSASVPLILQNSGAINYVGGILLPTGGPDNAAVRQRQSGRTVPMGGGSGRASRSSGSGGGQPGLYPAVTAAQTATDTVQAPGSYQLHVADPLLSAGVDVQRGYGVLRAVALTAAVKAPVATLESGVGTGQWDFAGGASVVLGAGGLLVFGDASYWHYGDLPDLPLRDGVAYGLGVGAPLGGSWSAMASLAGASRVIPDVEPPLSITVSASHTVAAGRSLSAGIGLGLTEGTAAISGFLAWRFDLARLGSGLAPR